MSWIKQGRDFAFPDYKPQWPPEPSFELEKVIADVEVDLKTRSIRGSAVNVFKALTEMDKISLHAVDMNIKCVKVNGSEAEYSYDGKELKVFLPHKVGRGDSVEVSVTYEAIHPLAGVWFVPTDGYGAARFAYTQGQPEDTRYWLPTYDYPNRKTRVKLTIRTDKGLFVASNGVLVEKREDDGKVAWTFELNSRIPTYLIAFVVGDFSVKEERYGEVLLQYIVPKGREADIDRSFSKTKEMVAFFEEFTGVKYPYPKYAQACVDEFVAGGMENASITILTSMTLHDEKAHVDFRSEPLVSHELAHQWFGDYVTCRDWAHLWLNESFATLMEALWRRYELGENEFVYDLISMLDSYVSEYGRYSRPIVTRVYKYPDEVFDAHNYPKGALILWTLLNIVGEDVFRRAVKKYLERRKEDNADTDDLRKAFEEERGQPLEWFFEQYVFNSGHPVLSVNYKWDSKESVLELKVTQTQGKDSLEEYKLPLEVVFLGENYEEKRLFWIEERSSTFPVKLPSKPRAVCVDPDFKAFKVLNMNVGVDELLSMIKYCGKLYPRIMAVRELAKKGTPRVAEELKEYLFREEEFWGFRSEVARALGSIGGERSLNALLDALNKVRHPKVRRAIVRALGNFREERVGEALAEVLRDAEESYYVRAEAALSLAKIRYTRAFECLEEALSYPSHNDVIAASALEGLGMLGTDEAFNVVKKFLSKDKSLILRVAATAALGYFKVSREIIDLLEEQSRSRHPRLRGAVVRAASRSLSPRMLPLLEKLQRDVSGRVARMAHEAAEKIKKHMERGEEYRKLREELDKLREEERRLSERVERLERRG